MSQLPAGSPLTQRSIQTNAGLQSQFNPGDRLDRTLFTGIVVDAVQYAHCYLVHSDLGAMVPAYALSPNSLSAMGWRGYYMYLPGTRVLCYRPPGLNQQVVILGALNAENPWDKLNLADWIQQCGRSSFKDNAVHNYITTLNPPGLLRNFNNHRPVDALPGEYGWTNVLGMGVHLGTTMAYLRASEIAGLWVFHQNHLVRLAAWNFDFRSALRHEHSGSDEGEHNEYQRYAMYHWEAMGARDHHQTVHRVGPDRWRKDGTDAYYEPAVDDQLSIYRLQRFTGYLANGGERVILSTPPPSLETPERLSKKTRHLGLSETVRHSDGTLVQRSAKAIVSVKELLIPVPKQLKYPDHPTGDNVDDEVYRFAGHYNGAPIHRQDEPSFGSGNTDAQTRFDAYRDLHAWLVNSYGEAAFQGHVKDWYLPQEDELAAEWGVVNSGGAIDPLLYRPLGLEAWAKTPAFVDVKIDHRSGSNRRYYRSRSVIAQLDDGGVLIEDGYGSQIRMGGGSIVATAPGDVKLMPGRNCEVWAPRDVILKAGNCAEISASKKDVRIKAEANVQVLAGNGGLGGVLVESRGQGFTREFANRIGTDVRHSGIALVAKDSQIMSYANEQYHKALRTKKPAKFVIDVGSGRGDLFVFCRSEFKTVLDAAVVAYGTTPTGGGGSYVRADESSVFFGQKGLAVFAAGAVVVPDGSVFVNGVTWTGRVVHDAPPAGEDLPGVLPGPWPGGVGSFISSAAGANRSVQSAGRSLKQALGRVYLAGNNSAGNATFIKSVGFSCRTDQQYGVRNYTVHENRWQQNYRLLGTSSAVWVEPVVPTPSGRPTMPFPGYDTWQNRRAYVTQDSAYWDPAAGRNSDRRYDMPQTPPGTFVRLADGYCVTAQT